MSAGLSAHERAGIFAGLAGVLCAGDRQRAALDQPVERGLARALTAMRFTTAAQQIDHRLRPLRHRTPPGAMPGRYLPVSSTIKSG